jgi:hypothetical protein
MSLTTGKIVGSTSPFFSVARRVFASARDLGWLSPGAQISQFCFLAVLKFDREQ